jgi:hypothetical protein
MTRDVDPFQSEPMRPGAEDEVLLLDGHPSRHPDVLNYMKGLSDEKRQALLEYVTWQTQMVVVELIGLTEGYIRRDPYREYETAREMTRDALRRGQTYIQMVYDFQFFPGPDSRMPYLFWDKDAETFYWDMTTPAREETFLGFAHLDLHTMSALERDILDQPDPKEAQPLLDIFKEAYAEAAGPDGFGPEEPSDVF